MAFKWLGTDYFTPRMCVQSPLTPPLGVNPVKNVLMHTPYKNSLSGVHLAS